MFVILIFLRKICIESEKGTQDRRKRSKYTHNMSRRGYVNLVEDMVIKNVIVFYRYSKI